MSNKFEEGIANAYVNQINNESYFWDDKRYEYSPHEKISTFASAIGLRGEGDYYDDHGLDGEEQIAIQQTLERINSADLRVVYDKYLSEYMFQRFSSYIRNDVVEGLNLIFEEAQGE